MIENCAKAIDSFMVDYNVDIYITGSNAYLLSSEFSTMLSGRYVEIKMLPLSFKKILNFNEFEANISIDEKFQKYLQFGGMPVACEFNFNQHRVNNMLEGIYSTVILKDVLERNKVGNQSMFQKIVLFLADNIGSIVSPNSIGNYLAQEDDIDEGKKQKNPASRTVELYINMLQKSFIFYGIARFDIKGK